MISGHYMFVEATQGAEWDVATLLSPRTQFEGTVCVSFFVHMHGVHTGKLEVFIVDESDIHTRYERMVMVIYPRI